MKKNKKAIFVKPIQKKVFRKPIQNFENVQSQIDYEMNNQKMQYKKEYLKKRKEQLETRGCSFKPKINETSKQMVQESYVPLHEKELPTKWREAAPVIEEGLEEIRDPHPKRKFDENFYEKQ